MKKKLLYDFENYIKENQQEFFYIARIVTKDRDLAIESTVQLFSEIYGFFEKKEILNDNVQLYQLFIHIMRNVLNKADKGYMFYIVEEQDKNILDKDISDIYIDKEQFHKYILDSSDKLGYTFREIVALYDVALLPKEDIMLILEIDEEEFYQRLSKARENMIYNIKSKII